MTHLLTHGIKMQKKPKLAAISLSQKEMEVLSCHYAISIPHFYHSGPDPNVNIWHLYRKQDMTNVV